jgi:hypothetical protein
MGNRSSAGGITREFIDLPQIANEAESIEDREKVLGSVRNHHSRTRIFLIPKGAFSWNAPVKSGTA